jgi:hypothetical protein
MSKSGVDIQIPIIRGSTALIMTELYKSLKSLTIPGLNQVPASNSTLRKCVALDGLTAMEGSRIPSKHALSPVIEYMEANIPRLAQADIKKMLINEHTESKTKFAELQTTEEGLLKEYRELLTKQEGSIDKILSMIAANPGSSMDSMDQQLKREQAFILNLRLKIEQVLVTEEDLSMRLQGTFNTMSKAAGERPQSIQLIKDKRQENEAPLKPS